MEKIGVSLWIGDIPNYIISVIKNNAKLFDKFYLITDKDYFDNQNITVLNIDNFINFIKEFWKVNRVDIGPAQLSDILCYYPLEVLDSYGIIIDKVLYVDTDYVIYNRFLLNEIFEKMDKFILKDHAVRFQTLGTMYFNSAVSLDSRKAYKLEGDNKITWYHLKSALHKAIGSYLRSNDRSKYTQIGPSLINGDNMYKYRSIFESSIDTISVQPGIITSGENKFDLKPECLGVHITQSHFKPLGFSVSGWSLCDGKFLLNIHDKVNV